MEILACPIDKQHPLELYVFTEKTEIDEGMMFCSKCLRWYPIRDQIPELLPDELRKENEEIYFLKKWVDKIPEKILYDGKPFNLRGRQKASAHE
jgi:uncharacterized protein YbaR (Trm112 family)